MVFFLIALVLALVGSGAYAYYNNGAHDVTLPNYHFTGVPDWMPVAAAAGVVLFLFLLQAIYAGVRIRMLKRASERA